MSKTETTNQRNEAQFLAKVYSYILSLPDPPKQKGNASKDDLGQGKNEALQEDNVFVKNTVDRNYTLYISKESCEGGNHEG